MSDKPESDKKFQSTLAKPNMFPVEDYVSFSESLIWKLNHGFYQELGLEAWREGDVPYQLTSNSKVGKVYAEIVFGFLKDLAFQGKIEERVYILELGAGHGKLAFHMLKHLEKLIEQIKIELPPYCYVLSDIAEDNLSFYLDHPQLKTYMDEGKLDVAYFDMLTTNQIELRVSGQVFGQGSLKQPLVTIANYFFDSIPSELFYYKGGKVFDCQLSLSAYADPKQLSTQGLLKNLKLEYQILEHNEHYFGDAIFDTITNSYKDLVNDSYIIFPSAGLRGLEVIKNISTAGMMLVSIDKGFHEVHDLEGATAPKMMTHGSMSFSVNYHAVGEHCKAHDGTPWFPSSSTFHLELVCMMYLPEVDRFTDTRLAYQRYVDDFGPDDYNILKKLAFQLINDLSVPQILSYLRLAAYDSSVFVHFMGRLKTLLPSITYNERSRVSQAMNNTWEMYFSLNESYDLAFEFGGILYALAYYDEALIYFDRSENLYGHKPDTYYNIALCHYQLRQDDQFRKTLSDAKSKFPGYPNFAALDDLNLEAK